MLYLAIGAAALWFVLRMTNSGKVVRREWRLLSGGAALAAFVAAAYAGVRQAWAAMIVLVVVGIWLSTTARLNRSAPSQPRADGMSLEEARSILGVAPQADRAEINAAYTRLMRMAHPDKGGTTGLASQLNAARDRLLER